MKTKRASQSHLFASSVLLCTRSFPAVCGGDVCPVGAGVGCGGCLHRPPALYSVSKLPVVPQLRSVLYVCSCWHLLLPSGWPSFPPDRPNHPDSLQLTLTSSSLEGGLRCLEYKCSLFFSFFTARPLICSQFVCLVKQDCLAALWCKLSDRLEHFVPGSKHGNHC